MTLHIPWIFAWYLMTSCVTFFVYGYDKQKAARSAWRIKESTLHLLDAVGGFPGGFVAQRFFHHKWRKTKFMVVFWLTVTAHAAGWILWLVYRQ
jgi:uncharacterized membrane protein YsdA (DUF1294 family)